MCAKMTLNCGATFVKYLLCFLNFLFFIAGGALLVVSTWLAIDTPSFLLITKITQNDSLEGDSGFSGDITCAYILIGVGALILLLGFLGCCGAAIQSKGILATYGALVILVFLLEVTAGILIAVYRKEIDDKLENYLKKTLHQYNGDNETNTMTVAWNALMMEMECCGVNNYTDFENTSFWNRSNLQEIPKACCKYTRGEPEIFEDGVVARASGDNLALMDENCLYNATELNSNYLTGCHGQLKKLSERYCDILVGILLSVGVLEVLVISLAFCLCANIGTGKDK